MKKRNIGLCILFCIITFGIYYIYIFVSVTNATNKLAPKSATMGGVGAYFCSIFTFGIYLLYWCYRMGAKEGEMLNKDSSGILYLILGWFTGGLIPLLLGQSALNKTLDAAPVQE